MSKTLEDKSLAEVNFLNAEVSVRGTSAVLPIHMDDQVEPTKIIEYFSSKGFSNHQLKLFRSYLIIKNNKSKFSDKNDEVVIKGIESYCKEYISKFIKSANSNKNNKQYTETDLLRDLDIYFVKSEMNHLYEHRDDYSASIEIFGVLKFEASKDNDDLQIRIHNGTLPESIKEECDKLFNKLISQLFRYNGAFKE